MDIDKRNNIISVVLGIVIIFLAWFLYHSITAPWAEVEAERELRDQTRYRMLNVREALMTYERQNNEFPEDLDDLVEFLKTDEEMVQQGDSLFAHPMGLEYDPDSLVHSPRTSTRFEYARNDTIRPQLYLLEDPGSEDRIGDLETTTLRNAASWN